MIGRISLPVPGQEQETEVAQGLPGLFASRRSVREYTDERLGLAELGCLLWAGQGISHDSGNRTAPSAHALHPMSLFLVAGNVENVEPGLYEYKPDTHDLVPSAGGDFRNDLYRASLEDQPWVAACAALILVAGDVAGTEQEFSDQPPDGKRGNRYIYMEAGAVAQNIALQAAGLGLGSVLVGGFDDRRVKQSLGLQLDPLIMMPVGWIA